MDFFSMWLSSGDKLHPRHETPSSEGVLQAAYTAEFRHAPLEADLLELLLHFEAEGLTSCGCWQVACPWS